MRECCYYNCCNLHNFFYSVIVILRPKHLHAKFEESKEVFEQAGASSLDISNFIEEKQNGLVGHLKPGKEASFQKPLIVAYYQLDWKRDLKVKKRFLVIQA